MTVGVVADDSFAKPDHVPPRRYSRQVPLDFLAAHCGLRLSFEQALLGRQHAAEAVEVDRAPSRMIPGSKRRILATR